MIKNNQPLAADAQVISGLKTAGILILSLLAYVGTLWSMYSAYSAISGWNTKDILGFFSEFLFIGLYGLAIGLTIVCAAIAISLSKGRYRLNIQLLKVAIAIEIVVAVALLIRIFTA